MAAYVRSELEQIGVEVEEDGAAAAIGGQSGNLLARIGPDAAKSVLFCAHLDTVPHEGAVVPVVVDGGWESEGDTILGADNKAAVAVLLELARRATIEGAA
ncbi:MAG: M28 family peptidase, partial [Actinomycetes bacterium]